jgi:hypothetical protein
VQLQREPSNKYDNCALKVILTKGESHSQIGHVPRGLAALLSPLVDCSQLSCGTGRVTKISGYKGQSVSVSIDIKENPNAAPLPADLAKKKAELQKEMMVKPQRHAQQAASSNPSQQPASSQQAVAASRGVNHPSHQPTEHVQSGQSHKVLRLQELANSPLNPLISLEQLSAKLKHLHVLPAADGFSSSSSSSSSCPVESSDFLEKLVRRGAEMRRVNYEPMLWQIAAANPCLLHLLPGAGSHGQCEEDDGDPFHSLEQLEEEWLGDSEDLAAMELFEMGHLDEQRHREDVASTLASSLQQMQKLSHRKHLVFQVSLCPKPST